MVRAFIRIAKVAIRNGGSVSFEWPKTALGWAIAELIEFISEFGMVEVIVDGCACGVVNALGEPVLKQWRFIVSPNAPRLIASLQQVRCQHEKGFKHGELQGGSDTKKTEEYPLSLCRTYLVCSEVSCTRPACRAARATLRVLLSLSTLRRSRKGTANEGTCCPTSR